MSLTYTRARDRRLRPALSGISARAGHIALTAVAVVSACGLLLCYAGRIAATPSSGPVVNLSATPTAEELLPAMALAFADPADARFAARELAGRARADAAGALPNVGALTSLEVTLDAVDRARGLGVFARRAADIRTRAATAGAAVPTAMPLFTASEVAAMKPALVVRTAADHRWTVLACVLTLLASFQAISLVWGLRGVNADRLLLAAVHLLVALGAMAALSRPDPLRDTILLARYTTGVAMGAAACALASFVNVRASGILQLSYLALGGALSLALALVVLGTGPGTSGAKVNLGPWQPGEFVRLLLIVFLAGYLGRRWELVRQVREEVWRDRRLPGWVHLPRVEHLLPMLAGVGLALALFFALKDLGPALLIALLLLLMLSVARAGAGVFVVGIALLVVGFSAGYLLDISRTLTARVAMWHSPWENAVRGGDQVAHAIWSMATGGITGTGLGLGDTRYLPAGHTDLVLAAIGEELGLVGLLAALAAAVVLVARGFRVARGASSDAAFFLAFGLTLSLAVPMLMMAAGTLGLIPLTGVVTPFLSYGGSAMLVNFVAVGLLAAIGAAGEPAADLRPFRAPLRWVAAGLAAAALVVAGDWTRIQAAGPDVLLVRPQLSRQADGGLRYQYNPRVIDAARTLPRGVIRDRREVPLAADRTTLDTARAELERLRVSPRDVCAPDAPRCYPLGGRAFHLLGDSESRLNWAATNTSYVERDAEAGLRGYDDRAASVETGEGDGRTLSLKRDYTDLIPLVRHRWRPRHPSVVALRERARDVHLTIDARLQTQVASILARTAMAAGVRHGAVVVVDAATGEVLASVSYPWPESMAGDAPGRDALLDRARYGRYPPGSTFKLVTAAAALRLDPELHRLSFTCSRLPDHRAGVAIPGQRPVRDDVRDRRPHGAIAMRDGLVHSCNAYFAQLALRLGREPLARMAETAGLVFPDDTESEAPLDELSHAGYGQGAVLTTPLRMARVAAAIASDGMIREPPIVRGDAAPDPKRFLPAASARLLAGYMREAVTNGTGRALRSHPARIAGKTGTAEVARAASHAWFVGYAPAGPAARRIAFAVLLENAGYGGGAAAAVAGQVVTAASTLELAK